MVFLTPGTIMLWKTTREELSYGIPPASETLTATLTGRVKAWKQKEDMAVVKKGMRIELERKSVAY
jgi:hypothetical protein